jgi:hypothetical protein
VLYLGLDAQGNAVYGVYGFHTYYTAGNYTFAMGVYHGNAGAFATQFTLPGYVTVYQPSQEANLVTYNATLVNAYNVKQYYLNAFNQDHLNYQGFLANYYLSVFETNLDAYDDANGTFPPVFPQ